MFIEGLRGEKTPLTLGVCVLRHFHFIFFRD